ncbi:hypothetical protein PR048_005363, partial [Dryococelus australis]
MLKHTKVKLELLIDYERHLFIEEGIRGGVVQCVMCHAKANNKCIPFTYDASKPPVYLQYIDANNLYGWAMSLPLPVCDFQWVSTAIDSTLVPDDGLFGYVLEVDVEYPLQLHDLHKDLPFFPINE